MPRRNDDDKLKAGFEELVKPLEDSLFAGALRFTSNRADAEDLLQETYMRAYIGFKRDQNILKAKAWLFRIMTNAYINRYHKERKLPKRVSYEEGLDHLIDRLHAPLSDDPQRKFFSQLFDSEVKEALDGIPEQFRRAVILRDISGLSYEEIGVVLECPLGTVRSRISRGREMLFHKLYDYARDRGLLHESDVIRR